MPSVELRQVAAHVLLFGTSFFATAALAQQAVYLPDQGNSVVVDNPNDCDLEGSTDPCILISTLAVNPNDNFDITLINRGNFLTGGNGISTVAIGGTSSISIENLGAIVSGDVGQFPLRSKLLKRLDNRGMPGAWRSPEMAALVATARSFLQMLVRAEREAQAPVPTTGLPAPMAISMKLGTPAMAAAVAMQPVAWALDGASAQSATSGEITIEGNAELITTGDDAIGIHARLSIGFAEGGSGGDGGAVAAGGAGGAVRNRLAHTGWRYPLAGRNRRGWRTGRDLPRGARQAMAVLARQAGDAGNVTIHNTANHRHRRIWLRGRKAGPVRRLGFGGAGGNGGVAIGGAGGPGGAGSIGGVKVEGEPESGRAGTGGTGGTGGASGGAMGGAGGQGAQGTGGSTGLSAFVNTSSITTTGELADGLFVDSAGGRGFGGGGGSGGQATAGNGGNGGAAGAAGPSVAIVGATGGQGGTGGQAGSATGGAGGNGGNGIGGDSGDVELTNHSTVTTAGAHAPGIRVLSRGGDGAGGLGGDGGDALGGAGGNGGAGGAASMAPVGGTVVARPAMPGAPWAVQAARAAMDWAAMPAKSPSQTGVRSRPVGLTRPASMSRPVAAMALPRTVATVGMPRAASALPVVPVVQAAMVRVAAPAAPVATAARVVMPWVAMAAMAAMVRAATPASWL